jgi:hypothetical protein
MRASKASTGSKGWIRTRSTAAARAAAASAIAAGVCLSASAFAADRSAPTMLATVGGIPAAENSIETTDGRVFVSANGALYELTRADDGSWNKSEVAAVFADGSTHACYYLGLSEYNRRLYSVCTEDFYDLFAPKHLMALDLDAGTAAPLQEAGPLSTLGSPNGLASDGAGHLYYASFGILFPGSIHRITLSDSGSIAADVNVLQYQDLDPNGLKLSHGLLYVSADPVLGIGISQLIRYPLVRNRPTRPQVLYQAFASFDDFSLLDRGQILLAEFLWGRVIDLDEGSGRIRHAFRVQQPTSVRVLQSATGTTGPALLVTERGPDQALLLTNPWRLAPRP